MGFFEYVERSWLISFPPQGPPKTCDALKFGVLGVGDIVAMSLIAPANLHPEVIVEGIASRDREKAEEFAKKHGIPKVFGCYLDLVFDPSIDVVYIPLPNNVHIEWALKALSAGKHVLLEKPPASNTTEAELLFQSPLLQSPSPPVLLGAYHYRFQPCYIAFLALLDKPNIIHAKVTLTVLQNPFVKKDLRFVYRLAGGALMDMPYSMVLLRDIFGAEPEECTRCEVATMARPNDPLCDRSYDSFWRFPNGGVGEAKADLVGSTGLALRVTVMDERHWLDEAPNDSEGGKSPSATALVTHRAVVIPDETLPEGQEKLIEVKDEFVVRNKTDGMVVRKWTEKRTKEAYTLQAAGIDRVSAPYWTPYKYQLDEFVNHVRGREGTGVGFSSADGINQMRMTDMAYEKAGLPRRPTSNFRLEEEV
ncbi:D-xylose 1-dehydrogenase (NADP(+), D-xylono-1,5-lactone-forming) [Madurella fahalii]|uniref:D-xylose 1-dehydrogenase (NADP(+), D-xylono-1,5-lactone-forming) n=1 Tax=Madurella fahalii TaxID=1157608 RepID=A0ABQ0GDM1_9PEZI